MKSKYELTNDELKSIWIADIEYFKTEIIYDRPWLTSSVIQFYKNGNHTLTLEQIEKLEIDRVFKFKIFAKNKIQELELKIKELK